MIDLYRRRGAPPAELPEIAYTDAGLIRSDLANQQESREELGFVFFGSIDPQTQRVVKRGDSYVIEILPPDAIAVSADVVTMRQAKIALLEAEVLDAAEAAIAAMEGEAGKRARIEWTSATVLRRDHPLVAALGAQLGLDDAAIDALFAKAAQIP